METFENVVGTLNDLVWSTPSFFPFMVAVLLSFGIFITLRLGFVQIRHFRHGILTVTGKFDHPDAIDVNISALYALSQRWVLGISQVLQSPFIMASGALFWMGNCFWYGSKIY